MSKGAWWAFAILLVAIPGVRATDPDLPKIRIGLLEGMFKDVPKPLLAAMAEPFRSMMFKQTGLSGDVDMCPNSTCLAGKLKDRTVSIGVFHGFEYAWAKQANPNLVPLLVTVPHGRKVQALILVSAVSELKKPADLKGIGVVVPKALKAHSQLFLDKIRGQNPAIQIAANPASLTAEEAISAVAGGKEKAVITDIATLNGYYGLQPGAANQLRILAESELFPVAVIATEKGTLSEENLDRVRKLAGASKTAQGRTMLTMWAIKGFEMVPAEYEDHCKKILVNYPPSKVEDAAIGAKLK